MSDPAPATETARLRCLAPVAEPDCAGLVGQLTAAVAKLEQLTRQQEERDREQDTKIATLDRRLDTLQEQFAATLGTMLRKASPQLAGGAAGGAVLVELIRWALKLWGIG
jgi:hypothetical protein